MAVQPDVEAIISIGRARRTSLRRRQTMVTLIVSLGITATWIGYVAATGQWQRVGQHWASAATMTFGSFVAGSTPQGGGAVAFPVFTKVLEVPSEVARSFSLGIQSIGMTAASAGIVLNRRAISWPAIALAVPTSIAGFLLGYLLLVDQQAAFGPSKLPDPYVKVTFTLVVVAMAFITYLGYRNQLIERRHTIPRNLRTSCVVAICAMFGGVASSLVGSGADVFVYLAVVALAGLSPRVGVATSVLVMTMVSLVGFAIFALRDGHFAIDLTTDLSGISSVGGGSVSLDARAIGYSASGAIARAERYDLFGLWLAAVPVVGWGAPLGAWAASRASDRQVVKFLVALAVVELLSTALFVDELRQSAAIAVFAVTTLVGALLAVSLLHRHRVRLLHLAPFDLTTSLTREAVDVGPRLQRELGRPDSWSV